MYVLTDKFFKDFGAIFEDNEMVAALAESAPVVEQRFKKIKLGRNDYCYCDSGKKYKNCCLNKEYSG